MREFLKKLGWSILTWTRGLNHDHEGGSSRARLLHCTKEWLTPAISPNVGNSASSFLLVGICVRANPFNLTVVIFIYIWVQHVQQHKVALLVNSSISSLPFEWMRSSEFSFSGFAFVRHLPKPLSKSCQWQSQFHLSLKHVFEAAGLCVARTHVI